MTLLFLIVEIEHLAARLTLDGADQLLELTYF